MGQDKMPNQIDSAENQQGGEGRRGICYYLLTGLSLLLCILTIPLSLLFSLRSVPMHERAVIFRLGQQTPGVKGPGVFFILPCIDTYKKVDVKNIPQECLTRYSKVAVPVDAFAS